MKEGGEKKNTQLDNDIVLRGKIAIPQLNGAIVINSPWSAAPEINGHDYI